MKQPTIEQLAEAACKFPYRSHEQFISSLFKTYFEKKRHKEADLMKKNYMTDKEFKDKCLEIYYDNKYKFIK